MPSSIPDSRSVMSLCRFAMAVLLLYCSGSELTRAQSSSEWLIPVSGSWSDGSNWSTSPVAPLASDDVATISANGSPYTIRFSENVSIDSLTINSPDATVYLNGKVLSASSGVVVDSGRLSLVSSTLRDTRLSGDGELLFSLASSQVTTFDNITIATDVSARALDFDGHVELENAILSSVEGDLKVFAAGSNQGVGGNGVWRVGDTAPAHASGSSYRLNGFGEFVIGADMRLESVGRRTSFYSNSNTTLVNYGTIVADASGEFLHFYHPVRNEGVIRVTNRGCEPLASLRPTSAGRGSSH
jgi:hypothetical protein